MNEFEGGHVWGFVSNKEEMKLLLDTRIMKLCFTDRKDFIDKKKIDQHVMIIWSVNLKMIIGTGFFVN